MADELWNTLMKFHSEVAEPRIVGPILERIEASDRNARGNFDALWKAFEARVALLEEKIAELENEI